MPDYSAGYQQTLIDAIFHERDQQLQKAFRERMEKMERRDQLAQVSGIREEAVLDRLIELDIAPETLAAIEIVPLVCMAWADGEVQAKERETILAIATAAGIQPQDGRYPLLEHWLKWRPGDEMLQAWKHYVKGLCQRLGAQETERLQHELLDHARKVALAAGVFFGFGDKMSAAERSVLDELEQAFSS
jgi:hypothetical protein